MKRKNSLGCPKNPRVKMRLKINSWKAGTLKSASTSGSAPSRFILAVFPSAVIPFLPALLFDLFDPWAFAGMTCPVPS